MESVTRYMSDPNPGRALLLAAPPGGGKTRLGVRLAEQTAAAGHRVLYCGPRRDFYQDILGLADRPAWWYAWQPRQPGDLESDPPQPPTCRWTPQINAWLHRGYRAMDFCSNPRICGWEYVRDRCPYHRQKERGEPIVFGQHAHAALGHPLMERFSLIIGDELPLSAFLWRWHIPLSAIVPPDMDDPALETLLRNLRWLCSQTPEGATCWQGEALYQALPGGAAATLAILEQASIPLTAVALAPDLRTAGAAEDAPYAHLLKLAPLMLREVRRAVAGLPVLPRIQLQPDGLTLLLRHQPANLPAHVVWLDATGDGAIYQTLLDRPMEVVRPRVRMAGKVYQLWSSANNRGAVLDDRPDGTGRQRGVAKQDAIRQQIARICALHRYQHPTTITYKPLGNSLLPVAESVHFGAARGTNRLQDHDALFVIGAPMPTLATIQEIAAMLFFDRDEPFAADWHAIDVPFCGEAAAYSVGGFWNDPDLTILLRQLREAEILQAVHRIRPLRRQVDVWVLTNVVVPDLPVSLISLHELFDALDSSGQPLIGIDVLCWPGVLALPASEDDPLTVARIETEMQVSRRTAHRWFDALLQTGRYRLIEGTRTGQRGRNGRALCKEFQTTEIVSRS